jgi:hypothetical protein
MPFAVRQRELWWAPLFAASLAAAAVAFGFQGVDLPAQIYRVGLFHRDGLTLWDSQWYGGHWTFNYSVIFPPVAGLLGAGVTEVVSAAVASLAFDRLVMDHFGRKARIGSVIFATGTLAQVAIGQLPFLLGEALGLSAYWASTKRRWTRGVALAVATPLASPLAGAFLALAAMSGVVAAWPRRRLGMACIVGVSALPIVALALVFPGQGVMPFPAVDFICLVVIVVGGLVLAFLRERALRIGAGVYLIAIALSFALPTPVGGNISRLGECIGAPLIACVLAPRRGRWLAAAVLPLALLQWGPAVGTLVASRGDPSSDAAYFRPLIRFLDRHGNPPGRVEIVPTKLHWEAAYVAPFLPLARGWERQLDTASDPLFYADDALSANTYRAWLIDNGVRYVALPDVPLDYAAVAERRLIDNGIPGLRRAWQDSHWRVFAVTGSTGIVDGPARLVQLDGSAVAVHARSAGTIVVRVRYTPRWTLVSGHGCVSRGPSEWTQLTAAGSGEFRLKIGLFASPEESCR